MKRTQQHIVAERLIQSGYEIDRYSTRNYIRVVKQSLRDTDARKYFVVGPKGNLRLGESKYGSKAVAERGKELAWIESHLPPDGCLDKTWYDTQINKLMQHLDVTHQHSKRPRRGRWL